MGEQGDNQPWYSVRCVIRLPFSNGDTDSIYEERITVWRAASFADAISHAEREAADYAAPLNGEYVGLAQAYHMFDELLDGAEVFSLMRRSNLDADDYVARFFETGDEREADAP
jgi:hypothetical protein